MNKIYRFLFTIIAPAFLLQNLYAQDNAKPFVLGKTVTVHSTVLAEDRVLNIYLPEGYNPADTAHYPVIYLLDGGADEDFIHVAGIIQLDTFDWIARMPKAILVGIANTDRQRDFTYPTTLPGDAAKYKTAGKSAAFMDFIGKELQPYINKNYRTSQFKTLIGESLGGLFATEVLLKRPTLFSQYIIVSPSLWWDNGSLLRLDAGILHSSFTAPLKVYIGVGKEGVWPAEIPHVMEVDANLLADRLQNSDNKTLKVYFDYLPQENHATVSHQAIFNAFRLLYPEKK